MSRVVWRDGCGAPQVSNARYLPKKPVKWWGEAWLELTNGEHVKHSWRAPRPITVEQARLAMHAVVAEMREEYGAIGAVDAGFYMECR